MFLWHAEVLVSSPRALKLGAVGHTCKPSTHGLETRTSEVQGHAWLHSELKGNFDSVKPNQRGRKEGGGEKRNNYIFYDTQRNYPVQLSFYRANGHSESTTALKSPKTERTGEGHQAQQCFQFYPRKKERLDEN